MKNKLLKEITRLLKESPDNVELKKLLHSVQNESVGSIRAEAKRIQQFLKDRNYVYEVEHVRPMDGFAMVNEDGTKDSLLNKSEFYKAIHKVDGKSHTRTKDENLFYGRFVQAVGGFTKVTIVKPDGTTVVKKYNHGHDNFCKPLGFIRAVSKALGKELKQNG